MEMNSSSVRGGLQSSPPTGLGKILEIASPSPLTPLLEERGAVQRFDGIIIPGFINTAILINAPDGNGNINGKNLSVNENGMSAELCAKKILKAVGKGKEESLIGRKEILSVYINRFFPKIFSAVIRNHPVRKMKMIMKFI